MGVFYQMYYSGTPNGCVLQNVLQWNSWWVCFTKYTTLELLMGVFYKMYYIGTPDGCVLPNVLQWNSWWMCFTKRTTAELLIGVFYQTYNSRTPDECVLPNIQQRNSWWMCFTKCTTVELMMDAFYQMYNSGTPDRCVLPNIQQRNSWQETACLLTLCWHHPYALGVPPPESTKHRAMQLLGMQWYHSIFIWLHNGSAKHCTNWWWQWPASTPSPLTRHCSGHTSGHHQQNSYSHLFRNFNLHEQLTGKVESTDKATLHVSAYTDTHSHSLTYISNIINMARKVCSKHFTEKSLKFFCNN